MSILIPILAAMLLLALLMLLDSHRRLAMVRKQVATLNSQLLQLQTDSTENKKEEDKEVPEKVIVQKSRPDKIKDEFIARLITICSSNVSNKELLDIFDDLVLKLCPNFVEEFNALLQPEHYQKLGKRRSLTTDMRMAALIRMGIDDSASIADFMKFSPNTVYNYRARLKSKARGDRNEFENRIKEINL